MRRWFIPALAAAGLVLGCPAPQGNDLRALLPEAPVLEEWTIVEGPVEYGPEDLYDYLNGAAERYLSYGFVQALHVRYEIEGDVRLGITLDLYDMGSDQGAFGIYSMGRRRDGPALAWGAEGSATGNVAQAWQGRIFVHGIADYEEPSAVSAMHGMIRDVTGKIPGEGSWPVVLDPLPDQGLVARSEQYVAANLLGHSFLPGGVLATYRIDGHEARLFFSDLGSAAHAGDAVALLEDRRATRIDVHSTPSPGAGGFTYSDPEAGSGTVIAAGRFVAGIHSDTPDLPIESQHRLLGDLVSRLTPGK
jgi:Family of unknown function (DUF6599)